MKSSRWWISEIKFSAKVDAIYNVTYTEPYSSVLDDDPMGGQNPLQTKKCIISLN